eukprot:Polyplicarium_translucidae@DN1754_c0_g2_i1.p2
MARMPIFPIRAPGRRYANETSGTHVQKVSISSKPDLAHFADSQGGATRTQFSDAFHGARRQKHTYAATIAQTATTPPTTATRVTFNEGRSPRGSSATDPSSKFCAIYLGSRSRRPLPR